jgi:hypothetical protein
MCFVQSSCTALNRDDVYTDSEEKDVIQKDFIPKIIKSLGLFSVVSMCHCTTANSKSFRMPEGTCAFHSFQARHGFLKSFSLPQQAGRFLQASFESCSNKARMKQQHRHILILPKHHRHRSLNAIHGGLGCAICVLPITTIVGNAAHLRLNGADLE